MKKVKILKNTFAICVAIILINCYVFANENIMLESTISYTCDDSFCVTIPQTIVVGEEVNIEAMDVNIAPGKTIYVDLATANDYVEIHSVVNPDSILLVYFNSSDGNQVTGFNPTLATFGYGESGSKHFTTYINNTTDAIAGDYTGSVMFNIRCE